MVIACVVLALALLLTGMVEKATTRANAQQQQRRTASPTRRPAPDTAADNVRNAPAPVPATTGADSPEFLDFSFTVRSFLPMICMRRANADVYWPPRPPPCSNGKNAPGCSVYTTFLQCPLLAERSLGLVSGHPDFQISFPDSTWTDRSTGNFIWAPGGATAGVGRTTQSPPFNLLANAPVRLSRKLTPVVKDALVEDPDTGLFKMQYCGPDRFQCGVPVSMVDPTFVSDPTYTAYNLTTTSGPAEFDAWYRDNPFYNRRVGVVLRLQRTATTLSLIHI